MGLPRARFVDAAPTVEHLQALRAAGVSVRQLCADAKVPRTTVTALLNGSQRRLGRDVASRLLALTTSAGTTRVLSGPTQRLVDELVATGMSKRWILRELGLGHRTLMFGNTVSAARAEAVAALHDRVFGDRPKLDLDLRAIDAMERERETANRRFGELDQSWLRDGECRDMDSALFFDDDPEMHGQLSAVCSTCAVRERCLHFALEAGEPGYWGGTSEKDRRRIRREAKRRFVAA